MRLTLRYLGVSDCEMQEGSLRCDANVNIHIEKDGQTIATPIVEIKNLNSFRSVERAIQYEAERQYAQWKKDGKTIKDAPKQTVGLERPRGRDQGPAREGNGRRLPLFSRARPRPRRRRRRLDRPSQGLDRRASRRGAAERFSTEYGLSDYDANVLVEQGQDVADYYDAVAKATGAYKLASNWVQQDILRIVKERKIPIGEFPVGPEALADLINRVGRSELNTNQGREVLAKMIETGEPVEAIIEAGGYQDGLRPGYDRRRDRGRPGAPTPRPWKTSRAARRSPTPSRASSEARS